MGGCIKYRFLLEDGNNLKKYLKFIQKRAKSGAESLVLYFLPKIVLQNVAWHFLKAPNLVHSQA
jgi:hypothetical protein